MWKKIGVVGVDSGTCLIVDASYVCNNTDLLRDRLWRFVSVAVNNAKYGQLNFLKGHAGLAVVARTGLGDGTYDVMANIENIEGFGERVTELRITFDKVTSK